jgi:nicotinamide mononucleotide transporter
MSDVFRQIADQFAAAAPLDLANFVLGVIGVWLMIRQRLAAFPVGLVAVSVQGILFYQQKYFADALLQVFFFVTLAWGWRHWVRDRGDAPELPVTRLTARGWLLTLGASVAVTAGWALTLGPWLGSVQPWRDAFIAAFSVTAQVLQVRKIFENWLLWIVVNVVAVQSYLSAVGAYTALLYLIYLGLAVAGLLAWRKAMASAVGRVTAPGDPGPGPQSAG